MPGDHFFWGDLLLESLRDEIEGVWGDQLGASEGDCGVPGQGFVDGEWPEALGIKDSDPSASVCDAYPDLWVRREDPGRLNAGRSLCISAVHDPNGVSGSEPVLWIFTDSDGGLPVRLVVEALHHSVWRCERPGKHVWR